MDITNYIGKAIAYYRGQRGWSTVQLADESGLSQGSISLYENGKRQPSDNALNRISTALGVTVDLLVERAESMARSNESNQGTVVAESRSSEYNSEYDRLRRIERLYQLNDFIFEVSPDVLLTFNTKAIDLVDLVEYRGRKFPDTARIPGIRKNRSSLLAHLTEKVFDNFIRDHYDEIALRIDEELKRLELSAYDIIENLRDNQK